MTDCRKKDQRRGKFPWTKDNKMQFPRSHFSFKQFFFSSLLWDFSCISFPSLQIIKTAFLIFCLCFEIVIIKFYFDLPNILFHLFPIRFYLFGLSLKCILLSKVNFIPFSVLHDTVYLGLDQGRLSSKTETFKYCLL